MAYCAVLSSEGKFQVASNAQHDSETYDETVKILLAVLIQQSAWGRMIVRYKPSLAAVVSLGLSITILPLLDFAHIISTAQDGPD